ncbi:response regulator transcription factor [Litchfieldia alkalitelluris]|nr:response regulator transcription factor [Litchfieldia alkalitelluris]
MKGHEKAIIKEWQNILSHLQETGRKSARNVEETMNFFSAFLFSDEKSEKDIGNNITYLQQKPQHNISIQTNRFVITLLENAAHKVLQERVAHYYQNHQAVHYLFTKLSEDITELPYHHFFSIDYFLRNLVTSRQLQIEWGAIVIKHEKEKYYFVEKWFNHTDQDLLLENDVLKANSIFALSELMLRQMEDQDRKIYTVLPIPYQDITILICVTDDDASRVIPFVTYALQIFENGKDTLTKTKDEQHWKDSVIMFNETLLHSNNYHEAMEHITAGYVNYLPFERCALFSYSMSEEMGVGLFGHRFDNQAVQSISEEISNLPIIANNLNILRLFKKSLNYIQPFYIEDANLSFPKQYIEQFQLRSLVVAPIYTSVNNRLLGAAILDQGPDKYFKVTQETFTALTKFGKSAGELLAKFHKKEQNNSYEKQSFHLSRREIEVLKLMAEGASTTEAAHELSLSEYTVRDYISTVMQKMEARNRTEAVARAIRQGII